MKLSFLCLALVLLIPYILATYGAVYRKQSFGAVDNANPRAQAAQLDAYGARIYASQQNAWEAATLFSASLLAARVTGVESSHVVIASTLFLAFRVLHPIAYLKQWSTFRSTVSTAGLACCAWLLASSVAAA
ncbi:MAG: MAPEG family protein [Proteobacteria bacterium]|nr:MAPEG family protein [Pseudomonadota bacterium]